MTKNENSITLRDVYDVVNRLEEKIDRRMRQLEDRVGILEDFKSKVLGMAAIVSAFVGSVTAWIWKKITSSE